MRRAALVIPSEAKARGGRGGALGTLHGEAGALCFLHGCRVPGCKYSMYTCLHDSSHEYGMPGVEGCCRFCRLSVAVGAPPASQPASWQATTSKLAIYLICCSPLYLETAMDSIKINGLRC